MATNTGIPDKNTGDTFTAAEFNTLNTTINELVDESGDGIMLAPDLTFPSSRVSSANYVRVDGIDASGGLTSVLSLTGKFSVDLARLALLTAETITVKLTVDSVVVWNDTFTPPTSLPLIGSVSGVVDMNPSVICQESFLLEVQTATDPSIRLEYLARPIL
jgi:hypothetical protein